MAKPRSTQEMQDAVVAAYLAGGAIPAIEKEFGIGRSSLYWYLRKAGVPNRASQRHERDSTADMIIAGLRELIALQDRRIAELEDENAALTKREVVAELAERRERRRKSG